MNRLLSISPDFGEALAAIYRSAFTGLKRYFCFLATLGTNRGVHLARFPAAGAHSLGFPCLPTGRAPLGFVGVAFRPEKFLVFSAEVERGAAIGTLDRLILKTHRMTSSLTYFSWSSGHPILRKMLGDLEKSTK